MLLQRRVFTPCTLEQIKCFSFLQTVGRLQHRLYDFWPTTGFGSGQVGLCEGKAGWELAKGNIVGFS